jgi:sugar phosphate isomerase/epimerase
MEFVLSTASLYSFPLEEIFRLAREAGFGGVELMVTNSEESRQADRIADLASRYEVAVKSIHAPFLLAARKVWGDHRSKTERSIVMAEKLGAKVVVVHLPYYWQPRFAWWMAKNIDGAGSEEVVVAVENAILLKILRPVNLSYFNNLKGLRRFPHLVFDTSHFAVAGMDILRAWQELEDKVCHVHLSNNYMRGYDDHALPFEGRIPLDRFLRRLKEGGYSGLVTLELSPASLEARLGEKRLLGNLKRSLAFCLEHGGS